MKSFHQICDQYKRLDAENYRLLSAARRKGMKYDAVREHYARRARHLYNALMSTIYKYGERCRAAGMRWDADMEEYVN